MKIEGVLIFLDVEKRYAGGKINAARWKFGPNNFKYDILFEKEYQTYKQAKRELNKKEIAFIKKFDSFKHGLNGTYGGSNYSAKNFKICIKAKFRNLFKILHK